jgi:predicted glycogen debranching enzyme
MRHFSDDWREWLEADGLGGFASGTVSGVRTRRYHGLLLSATAPPAGRVMLVNGFDAWVATAAGRFALSSQRYAPGVIYPDGAARIESFTIQPWPTWTYRLEDGTRVRQEIVVPRGHSAAIVTWRLATDDLDAADDPGEAPVTRDSVRLIVRPFISGRDYHSTHHENDSIAGDAQVRDGIVVWRTYDGLPSIVSHANARYEHAPDWYRRFEYAAERERGPDDVEDLFSPGELIWELGAADAMWCVSAGEMSQEPTSPPASSQLGAAAQTATSRIVSRQSPATTDVLSLDAIARLREDERARRAAFASPLHRAADAYLVRRQQGQTIVAGYPWFTDWGRDTFIAIRGLCLSTGRFDDAREILVEWAGVVSEGMVPNRFPDAGGAPPEFNAVDASLWFIAAVHDYLAIVDSGRASCPSSARDTLDAAMHAVLDGYARGTRYGIRMDDDGLLACGERGQQLTWMDARAGGREVTPRIGKPVEVQALWLNALLAGAAREPHHSHESDDSRNSHESHDSRGARGSRGSRWQEIYDRAKLSFEQRFWNDADGCLYDVVDVDHERGRVDASFRPNQIFAIGGLRQAFIEPSRARLVVDAVERELLTPLGLRSLSPRDPAYVPHYGGSPEQRDAAYHQGTVWPWLMGAFVEAWLRVREISPATIAEARDRFVAPLLAHLDEAGLGHVSEIADAEPPFTPAGCPFQAWSLGELLRVLALLEAESATDAPAAGSAPRAGSQKCVTAPGAVPY